MKMYATSSQAEPDHCRSSTACNNGLDATTVVGAAHDQWPTPTFHLPYCCYDNSLTVLCPCQPSVNLLLVSSLLLVHHTAIHSSTRNTCTIMPLLLQQALDMSGSNVEAACAVSVLPLRLPAPLVTLVLQYLPLTQKFTACSHICRSFPHLESVHFIFDAIDLQPAIMSVLLASPSLRHLLCNLTCVLLHDADRAASVQREALTSRVHHQPSRPAWFPRTQRVAITGMVERSPFALLHTMLVPQPLPLPPSSRLPLLHTLRLSVIEQLGEPMEHTASSLSPLLLLPLLRTLVIDELEGGMDYAAFRFLCSLPLAHLALHGVHVTPTTTTSGTSDETVAEQLPAITDTWSVLRLPTFDPAVWLTEEMLDTLLEPYVGRGSATAGLRYISLDTPQPVPVFRRLAAVRTLQSFDLCLQPRRGVPTGSGALPVEPFLASPICPSTASWPVQSLPSLPHLRHVRIRNNLPARIDLPYVVGSDCRVTSATPYVRLITAYSQQLRALSISRLYPFDRRLGVWEAIGMCSQLRVFELTGSLGTRVDECDPPPLQLQLPPLPHLHTLRLRVPAHPMDILSLVKACSNTLEDYRQTGPFPLPLEVLRVIGDQCLQLRRLECSVEAEEAATPAAVGAAQLQPPLPLLTPPTNATLFPRLVSLTVHAERRPSKGSTSPLSVPSATPMQTGPLSAIPAVVVFPATQPSHLTGPLLSPSAAAMQPTVSAIFPPSSSPASPLPILPATQPVVHLQPEHSATNHTTASIDEPRRLSDRTVCELAAIVAHSPVRYLDAPGVPLLSVHHFAPLSQLRALRCQQSHVQQPSHVYVPAESLMPRQLRRYFVTQPSPPQPATRDQMDKMLLTSDLIDDERPVADWQLDGQLDEDARGTSWAPSCQRFVRERQFDAGMDGREAFMAAVRDMAEAGLGTEEVDGMFAGKRKRSITELAELSTRRRTATDLP